MDIKDYIREVDEIHAPDELKRKIGSMKKKKGIMYYRKYIAAAAAFVIVFAAAGTMLFSRLGNQKFASDIKPVEDESSQEYSYSLKDEAGSGMSVLTDTVSTASVFQNRKIIKTVHLNAETKNYSDFIKKLNTEIKNLGGYIEQEQEYLNEYKNSCIRIRVPAEKLDSFTEKVGVIGKITYKEISSDDITDAYIDVQSRIDALKAEEKALLSLLEKAQSVSDIISVRERLTSVQSDLDSFSKQKKTYDSQTEYSTVELNVTETQSFTNTDKSFFSEIKERFSQNIRDIGLFFREAAITVIGGLPYILIFAAIAAAVIIIIKKKKK